MLSHEERVTLVLPDQPVTQGTGYSDYYDAVVSALTSRRMMLDTALAQFMTRAED